MPNGALFVLLAATVASLFAFVSIAVWVNARTGERRERDRFALLKAVVEHPGENADRVLALLREQDERQAARRAREERNGFLIGGATCLASGLGLGVMMSAVARSGTWTLGLIPGLIGVALLVAGTFLVPARGPERR